MDKGIEEASAEPEVVEAQEPADLAAPELTDAEKAAKVEADAKAAADAAEAAAKEGPQDVEQEIKDLGIKNEKAAERFRGMTKEIGTLRSALKAAGVEDVAALPELVARAKNGEDMIGMVMDTGADAEHFGQALEFLKLDAAAVRGDKAAAKQAFEILQVQIQGYARTLGIEVPGIADPLADHPDLLAEIEAGDLTRKRALEIVGTRNHEALTNTHATRVQEREGLTRKQQEAVEQGRQDIVAWDADMIANDPTYASKRDALFPLVAEIRATKPPHDWARLAALAYARIPTPQAAPVQTTKPPVGPVRSNRGTSGMVPDLRTMTPEQALDVALGM